MTTLTVKVDVDVDADRIAVWKDGIGWVEMDRGWFADLLTKVYTEDEMEEALTERDDAIDMADRLSWAIAPMEVIGEHSSGNDPWANALDEAYALHWSAETGAVAREALGKAMASIELLVYALRFHNLDADGDPLTCLPGCIACQAIAAYASGLFTQPNSHEDAP